MRFIKFTIFILFISTPIFAQDCWEEYRKTMTSLNKAINDATEEKKIDSLIALSESTFKKLKGCKIPEFSVKSINGRTINPEKLKNKIIVINFWFTGCKPCIAEFSALNALVEKYNQKDIVFIGFAGDTKAKLLPFLKKYPFNYLIIPDSKHISDIFGIQAWPTNIVCNRKGEIINISHGGYIDDRAKTAIFNKLSPVIDELLQN